MYSNTHFNSRETVPLISWFISINIFKINYIHNFLILYGRNFGELARVAGNNLRWDLLSSPFYCAGVWVVSHYLNKRTRMGGGHFYYFYLSSRGSNPRVGIHSNLWPLETPSLRISPTYHRKFRNFLRLILWSLYLTSPSSILNERKREEGYSGFL